MKNIILTTLTLLSACVFAEQPFDTLPSTINSGSSLPPLPLERISVPKQGFVYFKFTAAQSDIIHGNPVLPGLGIGYRRVALTGNNAVDISIHGIGRADRMHGRIFWTAPKASYIHYFQPNAKQTPYISGGMAWGGVETKDSRFTGLIPSAALGYEFVHKGSFLGFSELNISQPALSVYQKGSFPGPSIELSTGIGF